MAIHIDLDCKLNNRREFFRHQSAVLASTKVYYDYIATKEVLFGIEPEMFVEQWIQTNILGYDKSFEDLILIYFLKILQVVQNNAK